MHSFLLTLTKTDARLELRKGENIVAAKSWAESRDMGRQLFEAIQALLEGSGLKPGAVADFRVKTDVSDNFTSVKIAETVAKVYTWSVSVQAKTTKKS